MAVVVTAMDVGVVIFGTGGAAIGGMRIKSASGIGGGGGTDMFATKTGVSLEKFRKSVISVRC